MKERQVGGSKNINPGSTPSRCSEEEVKQGRGEGGDEGSVVVMVVGEAREEREGGGKASVQAHPAGVRHCENTKKKGKNDEGGDD